MATNSLQWTPPYSWCPANFGAHRGYTCPMPPLPLMPQVPGIGHEIGLSPRAVIDYSAAFGAQIEKHHVMLGLPAGAGTPNAAGITPYAKAFQAAAIRHMKPTWGVAHSLAKIPPPPVRDVTVLGALSDFYRRRAEAAAPDQVVTL